MLIRTVLNILHSGFVYKYFVVLKLKVISAMLDATERRVMLVSQVTLAPLVSSATEDLMVNLVSKEISASLAVQDLQADEDHLVYPDLRANAVVLDSKETMVDQEDTAERVSTEISDTLDLSAKRESPRSVDQRDWEEIQVNCRL